MPSNRLYQVSDSRVLRRRAVVAEEHFQYLRAGAVQHALEHLKKYNLYPVAVKKKDMPTNAPWNNFTEVSEYN